MSPADRDALVEQVAGALRVRAGDDLTYHKAWHDLGPADRARAHALASALRPVEAALDPDGLSTTGRAVLARIPPPRL